MNKAARFPAFYIAIILLLVFGASLIVFGLMQDGITPTQQEARETISFAIYGDAEQRRIVSETVKYFESEYNCKVEIFSFSTIESLQTRVLSQYSAGDPFDVFYVDRLRLVKLKNKILPLDDILAQIEAEGDAFIEAALEEGAIIETQYALPTGVRPYCMYYNVQELSYNDRKTPQQYIDNKVWDLTNFESYCREIYELSGQPVFAVAGELESLYSFVIGNGGHVIAFDEQGKPVLDAKGKESVAVLDGLIDLGAVVSVNGLQWGSDSLSLFRSESIPIVAGSINFIYELYEPATFDWDIIPMPMIAGDYSSTLIDVPQIAAAKGDNSSLAKEFVRFFVSSYGQKIRLQEGERLLSSLNMAFYTSFGNVYYPDHSNYLLFIAESGKTLKSHGMIAGTDEIALDNYIRFLDREISLEEFVGN